MNMGSRPTSASGQALVPGMPVLRPVFIPCLIRCGFQAQAEANERNAYVRTSVCMNNDHEQ